MIHYFENVWLANTKWDDIILENFVFPSRFFSFWNYDHMWYILYKHIYFIWIILMLHALDEGRSMYSFLVSALINIARCSLPPPIPCPVRKNWQDSSSNAAFMVDAFTLALSGLLAHARYTDPMRRWINIKPTLVSASCPLGRMVQQSGWLVRGPAWIIMHLMKHLPQERANYVTLI